MKRKKQKSTKRTPLVVCVVSGLFGALIACALYFGSAYVPGASINIWSIDSIARKCGLCLNDVIVFGRCRSDVDAVLAAISRPKGESIFSCDVKGIRDRLMNLTWVADVSVRRSICGELYIHLTEREPIAVYDSGSKLFLVDRHGTLIDTAIDPCFRGLPVLYGHRAEQFAVELLEKLQQYKSVRANTTAMSLIKGRRWDLKLVNRVKIKLPAQNVDKALQTLERLIDEGHISSGDIVSVDLRSDKRFFLQLSDAGRAYYLKRRKSKSV